MFGDPRNTSSRDPRLITSMLWTVERYGFSVLPETLHYRIPNHCITVSLHHCIAGSNGTGFPLLPKCCITESRFTVSLHHCNAGSNGSGFPVLQNHCFAYFTYFAEQLIEVLIRGIPRDASNKHFSTHFSILYPATALACCKHSLLERTLPVHFPHGKR